MIITNVFGKAGNKNASEIEQYAKDCGASAVLHQEGEVIVRFYKSHFQEKVIAECSAFRSLLNEQMFFPIDYNYNQYEAYIIYMVGKKESLKSYYFFSQKAADHYARQNRMNFSGERGRDYSKTTINGIPYTEVRADGVKEPYAKWDDAILVAEGYGYEGVAINGIW